MRHRDDLEDEAHALKRNVRWSYLTLTVEDYQRGVEYGQRQAIDVLGGDLLGRIADLRSRAGDAQRDTYTVVLGQMRHLGLITEEQWQEALDRERIGHGAKGL